MSRDRIIDALETDVASDLARYLGRLNTARDPYTELTLAASLIELAAHRRAQAGNTKRIECLLAISVWLFRFVTGGSDTERTDMGSDADELAPLAGKQPF